MTVPISDIEKVIERLTARMEACLEDGRPSRADAYETAISLLEGLLPITYTIEKK